MVSADKNFKEIDSRKLRSIVEKFAIRGKVQSIEKINKGYINQTYKVDTLSEAGHIHKYILQRINNDVFKDVGLLMNNYWMVTEKLKTSYHLPGSAKGELSVLSLRLTKDGRTFLSDKTGFWRMAKFIDNTYSMDVAETPEIFGTAGEAFGLFIKRLAEIPLEDISETIPNFHNTVSRYRDLKSAIEADCCGRVREVGPELEMIEKRMDCYSVICQALENGEIPTRICHNDCNLNNILFDKTTHLPVAVIDIDTVMPSSPLYDFGDSVRVGTCTAKDDEKDLSKVFCDLRYFEAYARGFLKSCGELLTKKELELLPYASIIITSEDGIRFLTDYISGDVYYKTDRPGQNLDRARTQLHLAEDMIEKLPEFQRILQNIYQETGLTV